ncbi:MAG: hypothetical protein ABII23_06910, partial [bacterium]
MHFLFFNRILIDDIVITDPADEAAKPPILEISRLIVSYNIISLLFNYTQPVKAISKIKIVDFTARIAVPFLNVKETAQKLALPDIIWEKGKLLVYAGGREDALPEVFELNNMEGSSRQTAGTRNVNASCLIYGIGSLNIHGSIRDDGAWSGAAGFKIKQFSSSMIPDELNIIKPWVKNLTLKGLADIQVELSGDINNKIPVSNWSSSASVVDTVISLTRDTGKLDLSVTSDFMVTQNTCTIKNADITMPKNTRLKIEGAIQRPFDQFISSLNFEAEHLNLDDIRSIYQAPELDKFPVIDAEVKGHFSGTLAEPVIDMEVRNAGWAFTENISGDASFHYSYKDNNIRLSNILVTTADGALRGEAHFMPQDWSASCTIEAVESAKLIPWLPEDLLSGRLEGSLVLEGDARNPRISGNLLSKDFSFFKAQYPDFSCSIHYIDNRFIIESAAPSGKFDSHLEIRKSEDVLLLQQLDVVSPAVSITSKGIIYNADKKMDIAFNASNISVDYISEKFPFFKGFKGTVELKGSVKGNLRNPLFIGKCGVSENNAEYFSAEISADSNEMRLLNIIFLENLTGSGRWNLTSGELELNVTEENFELARINTYFNMPVSIRGKASGTQKFARIINTAFIKKEGDKSFIDAMRKKFSFFLNPPDMPKKTHIWRSDGNIQIDNGDFNGIVFNELQLQADLTESMLNLKNISIMQADGNCKGSGMIRFNNKENNLNVNLNCKQFALKNIHIDGEISLSGDYNNNDINVDVYSPSFWFLGVRTGELKGKILFESSILTFADWRMGEFISGKALIDFNAEDAALDGTISADLKDLALLHEMTPLEQWRDITGSGNLKLSLEGSLADPVFKFNVSIPEAHWKDMNVGIQGDLLYQQRRWTIPEMMLDFKESGTIRLTGMYGYNEFDAAPRFESELSHLDFSIARSFVDLPEWITGQVSGKILISGSIAEPVFSGALSGDKTVMGTTVIDNWRGELTLIKNKLDIHKMTITRGAELWNLAEGSYLTFTTDNQISFLANVELRNIYIGMFSVFGGMSIRGNWDFSKKLPNELELITRSMWINQHDFERAV